MGSVAPDYGRRLLPSYIDELAEHDPDFPRHLIPQTPDVADGYATVTNKRLANAINRTAWWFEENLGKSKSFEVVGYIGPNDLRYPILIVAAAKAGYQMLFSSPRNSLDGHSALIKATNCKKWVLASGTDVKAILEGHEMETFQLPELWEIVDEEEVKPYPYTKSFDEARYDPLLMLHTSGSTGLPKPINLRQGSPTILDAYFLMDDYEGRRPLITDWTKQRVFCSFPPFHSAGICIGFFGGIYANYTTIWPPPGPVTMTTVEQALEFGNPTAAGLAPSTLEEFVKAPESLEKLSKLWFITSGGGPIARHVGDLIQTKTNLWITFGMTESHWYPTVRPDKDAWDYYKFHPQSGFDFRERAEGLFELVIVRKPEFSLWQPAFQVFPDEDEFPTKDLWSKHPTRKGYWKFASRGDDIVVLSNGEKFNPLTMEGELGSHPLIKSAIIAGQGRFQISAILELAEGTELNSDEVIQEIWPLVVKCNKEAPAHAQLDRWHILIASENKPFPRAGKGTVQRRATIELYKEELENLYEQAETRLMESVKKIDVSREESTTAGVLIAVQEVSGKQNFSEDEQTADLFALGFDSLKVLQLQRYLKAALRDEDIDIDQRIIYANPSIQALSTAIYNLKNSGENTVSAAEHRKAEIAAMVSKYSVKADINAKPESMNVVLTGSTGSLGSYLLDALVGNKTVDKIWCINRTSDAKERQTKLALERGLKSEWNASVKFLQVENLKDLSNSIPRADLEDLRLNVTHIIHNAWRVDFNLTLSSFESQVAGVRALLDFSKTAMSKVSFFFISSIGIAANWDKTEKVPEREIESHNWHVAGMGYGESKLVAEQLINEAALAGSIEARICRVGQIAGPVKNGSKYGMWNRNEWLPTIIDTSAKLGALPSSLGSMETVDWIPVDLLAEILLELATPSSEQRVQYFHAVNPHTSSWSDLVEGIQTRIEASTHSKIKLVDLNEWLSALRNVAREHRGGDVVSGVKLLDFYESLNTDEKAVKRATFATENTEAHSHLLRSLNACSQEWIQTWLGQWGY